MLKLACILALALAPGGAPVLWKDRPGNGGWWVQKPPSRFMRGQGAATIGYVAPEAMAEYCGGVALACTLTMAGKPPLIVMPDPCAREFRDEDYARLQCHENSHAFGGWKHEAA
jgi:hypothetical protein